MPLPPRRSATGRLVVYPPSHMAITYGAGASTPAASSNASNDTPFQRVPSLDHFVTQWMSTTTSVAGSARSSLHDRRKSSPPSGASKENDHRSSEVRGVGPADSTGKSSVTYWPRGTRPAALSLLRLPVNPLVAMRPPPPWLKTSF